MEGRRRSSGSPGSRRSSAKGLMKRLSLTSKNMKFLDGGDDTNAQSTVSSAPPAPATLVEIFSSFSNDGGNYVTMSDTQLSIGHQIQQCHKPCLDRLTVTNQGGRGKNGKEEVFACEGNVLSRTGEKFLYDERDWAVFVMNRWVREGEYGNEYDASEAPPRWDVFHPNGPRAMKIVAAPLDEVGHIVRMQAAYVEATGGTRRNLILRGDTGLTARIERQSKSTCDDDGSAPEMKVTELVGKVFPPDTPRGSLHELLLEGRFRLHVVAGVDQAALLALSICYEEYCAHVRLKR